MSQIRALLSGGDRRSIAKSNQVRAAVERDPALVAELAALTGDDDWLVSLRAARFVIGEEIVVCE